MLSDLCRSFAKNSTSLLTVADVEIVWAQQMDCLDGG